MIQEQQQQTNQWVLTPVQFNLVTTKIDGCEEDMKVKNAKYIGRNVELNQEFSFAHPSTKLKINNIYNSHFTSSPPWNLFGPGALKIESSFNKSVKVMLDLPVATHRYLIEPLTGQMHVKKVLISRFLGFMEKIASSNKRAIKMLMETSKKDARSITGKNFRNIMLLVGKTSVDEVEKTDAENIKYHPIKSEDLWKVDAIQEIIEVKSRRLEIDDFNQDELEDILTYLCTS